MSKQLLAPLKAMKTDKCFWFLDEVWLLAYERIAVTDQLHERFSFRTDYQSIDLRNLKNNQEEETKK